MANPLDGMDENVLNEAVRYGLEFAEEEERRQRKVQAQTQVPGQATPQQRPPQHPALRHKAKYRKGRR